MLLLLLLLVGEVVYCCCVGGPASPGRGMKVRVAAGKDCMSVGKALHGYEMLPSQGVRDMRAETHRQQAQHNTHKTTRPLPRTHTHWRSPHEFTWLPEDSLNKQ